MADYKKMYFSLFNVMTDMINMMEDAQTAMEQEYIDSEPEAEDFNEHFNSIRFSGERRRAIDCIENIRGNVYKLK